MPLGVFLSGGVDSSSVAAALCELEPARDVRTFSIGFEDPSFDESGHARAVARHLGTDHHERTFSAETVYELLPEVAGWLDEPFGDASILPTHLLSRFARERGHGRRSAATAPTSCWPATRPSRPSGPPGSSAACPAPARALAGAAVGRLPVDHGNFSFDFKLKQFLRGAAEPLPLAHQRWLGLVLGAGDRAAPGRTAPALDVEAEHLAPGRARWPPGADPLTRSLALYQDTYLPEDILTKVDRASMACGLEVRAPFLDAELVDAIQALPAVVQVRPGPDQAVAQAGRGG